MDDPPTSSVADQITIVLFAKKFGKFGEYLGQP